MATAGYISAQSDSVFQMVSDSVFVRAENWLPIGDLFHRICYNYGNYACLTNVNKGVAAVTQF